MKLDNNTEKVKKNELNASVYYTTPYAKNVKITNEFTLEHGFIRTLVIDNGNESATFIDKNKHFELVYGYTKYYDLMFDVKENIKDVLMIGGAGYSYPKYFISHFPDKAMDVVEIDKEITSLAMEYFYLDELINEFDLYNNQRLNIFNTDGRFYLDNNKKKYDAILNDAFLGRMPAKTLTTLEAVNKIYSSLNEDGVYLTNIVSSLEGDSSMFLKSEVKTLKKVFKNVYVIPCYYKKIRNISQNFMVISSDCNLKYNDTVKVNYKNGIILTDNNCPIEVIFM